MSDNRSLDDLLRFDPLAEAERITGANLGHDLSDPTAAIGFFLAKRHNAMKVGALASHDDTMLNNRLDRYQRIIGELGFEQVLCDAFDSDGRTERFFVYAHRDGLLLRFDTWCQDHVNSSEVSYNWRQTVAINGVTSSGHCREDGIWVGDHDAREALRHKLAKLRAAGEFVSPWVERPFLWLLSYADTKVKDYDHNAINAERITRLPAWVREFIGPARQKSRGA